MKNLRIIYLILLCACNKQQDVKPTPPPSTFRIPSASEAFELQSKCSQLGEKILQDNFIGSALTQEQISYYNPLDNRCYVELNVHTADLSNPAARYIEHHSLFDGQTHEMLASAYVDGGKKSAFVFDPSLRKLVKDPTLATNDEVEELIDSFISPERRR